jgi:Parkin co-regulated protein
MASKPPSLLSAKLSQLKGLPKDVKAGAAKGSSVVSGGSVVARSSSSAKQQQPAAKRVPTELRRFYSRGDLPIQIDHGGVANRLAWKVEIKKLDFHHYLPIFFDGIREMEQPYALVAEQGITDMLEAAPHKVLPVIPQLIIPLKLALNTRDKPIIVKVLKTLQLLATCDNSIAGGAGLIGQSLVPYYRQLLPIFNTYINDTANLGDKIDYSGRGKHKNLGDLISETLEILELHGGEDSFINIKYLIPQYQSAACY